MLTLAAYWQIHSRDS